jgi:hypothetical protein
MKLNSSSNGSSLTAGARHAGPPLLPVALAYTALMIAGAVTLSATFSSPHAPGQETVAYIERFASRIRLGSFFELGSAIPLGVFVATVVSRLRFLRVRAAGEIIALCGGFGAMGMLMLSALSGWSATRPGIAEASGAVQVLQALSFAGGGPGFVAPLGLFLAGVSVTAGLHRLIPRWLMGLGIFVAVACELATLTLVVWNAAYFIPVGRFLGVVWMIGVAFTLPKTEAGGADRAERQTAA